MYFDFNSISSSLEPDTDDLTKHTNLFYVMNLILSIHISENLGKNSRNMITVHWQEFSELKIPYDTVVLLIMTYERKKT